MPLDRPFAKTFAASFCRYRVRLSGGNFQAIVPRPLGWFHTVLNYIGPENGQGVRIYHDGVHIGDESTIVVAAKNNGDGRIVMGRFFAEREGSYSSFQVDELLFFNQTLTDSEITTLSQLSN